MHWVRDVTFDEDASRIKTGEALQTVSTLRNAAIGLLSRTGVRNIAAAWQPVHVGEDGASADVTLVRPVGRPP